MQSTIPSPARPGPAGTDDRGPGTPALLAALGLLGFMLLLPGHPQRLVPGSFLHLPLELPALALALAWLRGPALRWLRVATVALLGTLLVLRLLDLGSYLAFDRRFSPLVELHLLGDGWNLASGAVGRWQAGLGIGAALLVPALMCIATRWATGALARVRGARRHVLSALCVASLCAGALATVAGRFPPPRAIDARASAAIWPELVERVGHMVRSVADQREFVAALGVDPVATGVGAPRYGALAGRDVGVVFVEAYGRSALDHERYAARARAKLGEVQARIEAAGLHAASGWATSPVRGGRSWLAQATFAAGLVVDDQARFDRLLGSDRRPASRLFQAAGWRTAALMPAIVEAWPEGAWYGFDRILDGRTSGYAGEPFGWVTMPDQYTLSVLQRLRDETDAPLMSTVALISTHAPWTPVPRIVDWDAVGDGSIFDGTRRFGEPVTWTEPDAVRRMYAETLDYTLETVGQYLERYAGNGFFIVLGDHQPASIIDGWGRTADVPVHVVTDDPALLARLPRDAFAPGMVPADGARRLPMESLRELFATRYESARPATAGITPRPPP